MKNRQDTGTLALIVTALIGAVVCFALLAALPTIQAQDTAPAWEYAALMYGAGDAFAFTGDNAATNEINKTLDALGDNQTNIIAAMNIMGLQGWEYTTSENAGNGVSMLVFKRLK